MSDNEAIQIINMFKKMGYRLIYEHKVFLSAKSGGLPSFDLDLLAEPVDRLPSSSKQKKTRRYFLEKDGSSLVVLESVYNYVEGHLSGRTYVDSRAYPLFVVVHPEITDYVVKE